MCQVIERWGFKPQAYPVNSYMFMAIYSTVFLAILQDQAHRLCLGFFSRFIKTDFFPGGQSLCLTCRQPFWQFPLQ